MTNLYIIDKGTCFVCGAPTDRFYPHKRVHVCLQCNPLGEEFK